MKFTAALGLMAATAMADGAIPAIEFIDGFIIGALNEQGVASVETCVADFTPLVVDMTIAVHDFQEGSYRAIADGIYQLGQFISQVGVIMGDCALVSDEDVATLKAMGETFLHPVQLIMDAEKNVYVNHTEIYHDLVNAGDLMEAEEYEQAGEMYGTIVATVFWGTPTLTIHQ